MPWSFTLSLDETTYPLGVVQRTVYALADRLTCLVAQQPGRVLLEVMPLLLAGEGAPSAETARALLYRNLNDFALRERIRLETQGLCEWLARTALKEAGL